MIKLAVIIFHKNVRNYPAQWIAQCVNSIKNQTHKDFQVFEIDYGGDGVQIYPDSHFCTKDFKTHADAHNFLLDQVFKLGFDYAANVNIDDHYSPDRFEKQLVYAKQGYDVISSNFYNINAEGAIIDTMEMHGKDIIAEANKGHNVIAHPAVFYSKNFWTTCSRLIPDQIPVDDFELWKRSFDQYRFIILPDFLLYYRVHSHKISASR